MYCVPTSDPPLRSVIHWPDVQNSVGLRLVRCEKALSLINVSFEIYNKELIKTKIRPALLN